MPITPTDFRKIALSFPDTAEKAHMNHPDFRVAGKIFATLGYPDKSRGMVKLHPEHQDAFLREAPKAFTPCNGAWGRQGATSVNLKAVSKTTIRKALTAAWRNTAPKRTLQEFDQQAT